MFFVLRPFGYAPSFAKATEGRQGKLLRWGRPEKYAFGLLKINCGLVQKGYNCPGQSALDLASGAAGQKVIVWLVWKYRDSKNKKDAYFSITRFKETQGGVC